MTVTQCPAPVGSRWSKQMPYVGIDDDGNAVVGTSTVDQAWWQDGEWWVDYTTTFTVTEQLGCGVAAATAFIASRTRLPD